MLQVMLGSRHAKASSTQIILHSDILLQGLLWIFLLVVFLRIGEIRATHGQLSDVFKCFANSLSLYNSSAQNLDMPEVEDDNVRYERELVRLLQHSPHVNVRNTNYSGHTVLNV